MMDYAQRRQEQARQTEQAILQSTLELCRTRSFDKVSVREICGRAGITTGAFYHHFRSKDDLLDRGFAPLDSYMEQALAGYEDAHPQERLQRILTSYAQFMEDQGWELAARYYQRRLNAPDSVAPMDPTRYTLRAVLDCLERAQELGLLVPGRSPQWVSDFVLRHFRGVVLDWILHCGSYPLWSKLEQDYALFQSIFKATES